MADELFHIAETALRKLETGDTFTAPDEETWGDIPGFEGVYLVSSFGRVMRIGLTGKKQSRKGNAILKTTTASTGHCQVQLLRDGRIVHRPFICSLVMKIFAGVDVQARYVRHLDGDKSNNRLDNLTTKTLPTKAKKDSQRRRGMGLINRRAVLYLEQEGVARALLARAYGVTIGAITHLVERQENKLKHGKAMMKKEETDP